MRFLFFITFLCASIEGHSADHCTSGLNVTCPSAALVKVEIEPSAVGKVLSSSQSMSELVVPAIDSFVRSDAFKNLIFKPYDLKPLIMSFKKTDCEKHRPKNSEWSCEDASLCSGTKVPEALKLKFCPALECTWIWDIDRIEECKNDKVRISQLQFPDALKLNKLDVVPVGNPAIRFENGKLKACFKLSNLDLTTSLQVDFAQSRLSYPSIGLKELNLKINKAQEACATADINLNAANPSGVVTNIKLDTSGSAVMLSEEDIRQGVRDLRLDQITGYPEKDKAEVKDVAVPLFVLHLQPMIENGIKEALGKVFQEQISKAIGDLQRGKMDPVNLDFKQDSVLSEVSLGNFSVTKYVDLLECSVKKANKIPVPKDSNCLKVLYSSNNNHPYQINNLPTPAQALGFLSNQMKKNRVTSESLRSRLAALEPSMKGLKPAKLYQSQLSPLVKSIITNRIDDTTLRQMQFIPTLNNSLSAGVTVAIPELCQEGLSSRIGTSSVTMSSGKPCPVQLMVDINGLNKLLNLMYESGRLCHSGKGDPSQDARLLRMSNRRNPEKTGCHFILEETKEEGTSNGFSCYLYGAPQIEFDQSQRAYIMKMKTRDCYRDAAILGFGKVAGDMNFEIPVAPNICNKGDFCLNVGQPEWNATNTQFALNEGSALNGFVKDTINAKLQELIGQTLVLPLSSSSGAMGMVPLQGVPDGTAIDDDVFGACFEPKP